MNHFWSIYPLYAPENREYEMGTLTRQVSIKYYTAWKVSVFGIFLVCISPHSDWIRRDTSYLSIFSPNAGKYGPEKLRLRTLFTQCYSFEKILFPLDSHPKLFDFINPFHAIDLFIYPLKTSENQYSDVFRLYIKKSAAVNGSVEWILTCS